ncbi:MAG: hypothetical protein M3P93_12345 [Actinomycetota bacterium]|nr:hypothetical protein [Actinomycetota bacterium]
MRQQSGAATELSVFSGSVGAAAAAQLRRRVLLSDDGTVVDGIRSSSRAFHDAARGGRSSAALSAIRSTARAR